MDEPAPDAMPYGYARPMLELLADVGGAFSDDDTDIGELSVYEE